MVASTSQDIINGCFLTTASLYRHSLTCTSPPPPCSASVLPVITGLAEYRESMLAGGSLPPLSTRTSPSGQVIAQVWPRKMIPTFFPNFVGEVWMEPGKPASQGKVYKDKAAGRAKPGRVTLVLGEWIWMVSGGRRCGGWGPEV